MMGERRVLLAAVLALVLAAGPVLAQGQPGGQGGTQVQQAGKEHWIGIVRKSGEKYLLIAQDGLPYVLKGSDEAVAALESQRVEVAGTRDGQAIDVDRILAAPIVPRGGPTAGSTGEQGRGGQ